MEMIAAAAQWSGLSESEFRNLHLSVLFTVSLMRGRERALNL